MIAAVTFLLLTAAEPQLQPQEARCSARIAVPADVRTMAREPERWLGRCVRLDGYVDYNRFYSDIAGFYRYVASNYEDTRNEGWLGLYPPRRYGFRGPMRRGTLFGVVHNCETDRDRAEAEQPGSIVMMTGFCHYRYGLVLRRVEFRPQTRAEFERQMGEEQRRRFGDLETAHEAGPPPAEVRALFDRFITAVQTGDDETLRSVAILRHENEENESAGTAVGRAFLRGDGESPLVCASRRAATSSGRVLPSAGASSCRVLGMACLLLQDGGLYRPVADQRERCDRRSGAPMSAFRRSAMTTAGPRTGSA